MTGFSLLTDDDLHLFNEGTHHALGEKMGAHPVTAPDGALGTCFAVWAPNADSVSVIGDFNDWQADATPLAARDSSGVWEAFVPRVGQGALYKFHIRSPTHRFEADKTDPYGLHFQQAPATAAVVWSLDGFGWNDADWLAGRPRLNALDAPMSIYEVHLGSWMRGDANRMLSYDELAWRLGDHLERTGFTHVEFLPLTEHPFYGSWGYQTTGYFAPTSRYGTPQEFMGLVDHLHRRGFGVILDWVPSHFPNDPHALGLFDGTHLYEHADPRLGIHPDWDSYIFNYGRNEVRSFLLSSAMHWLGRYHVDALLGLLARAGRVGAEPARRPGEPGRRDVPAAHERGRVPRAPRFSDDRRRVHVLAQGDAADLHGGAGLRPEVGHGLDARHAPVHGARSDPPALAPHRPDVPRSVRVRRELRLAAVPRRGRPREGVADREDARGRLAALRESPAAVRLPMG
jgi:1,4-alpha-glucan branching enzyme